jgi:hypothetical protein
VASKLIFDSETGTINSHKAHIEVSNSTTKMHLLSRRDWEYKAPCPYVPTSEYDWKLSSMSVPEHCGTLPWNPVIYSLVAAFQAGTFLVGLEVIIQLFFQFKKRSLYFWYVALRHKSVRKTN